MKSQLQKAFSLYVDSYDIEMQYALLHYGKDIIIFIYQDSGEKARTKW